jgi:hypothetical protein
MCRHSLRSQLVQSEKYGSATWTSIWSFMEQSSVLSQWKTGRQRRILRVKIVARFTLLKATSTNSRVSNCLPSVAVKLKKGRTRSSLTFKTWSAGSKKETGKKLRIATWWWGAATIVFLCQFMAPHSTRTTKKLKFRRSTRLLSPAWFLVAWWWFLRTTWSIWWSQATTLW